MYKRILTAVTAIVLLCLPTAWAADTSATAAILMDGDTGEVLYEKNPDRQMLIASTTKLMTTLVVLERGGLGDVVTVTQQHIAEGSSMYLKPGDRVTVEELLYGLLLCSGNDAALALADHCGGLERFVAEMNRKAAELGMTGTSFANPNGLDQKGHYSTARDMAGLKTGYTRAAGRTLVSCVRRNGRTLVAVTLQDGNDWADHAALYEFGFGP